MNTKILGAKGEILATKFLKKQGYIIKQTNYKNKIGEIDIICYSKKNDETIFIEVKSRSSIDFGFPSEAVTNYKQNKIKKVAQIYLMQNNITDSKFRFDVVEILNDKINHIKYAF